MDFITPEILKSSAIALVAIVAILSGVKVVQIMRKKNGNGNEKKILEQVRIIQSNHLNSIEKAIREGNKETLKAINDGNTKIIQLLAEIRGKLSNMNGRR